MGAFWAILTGVFESIAGIRLRKAIASERALLLMGARSLLFGILQIILFARGAGALAIVRWIGVYALAFGIFLLVLAFRLRGRWASSQSPHASTPALRRLHPTPRPSRARRSWSSSPINDTPAHFTFEDTLGDVLAIVTATIPTFKSKSLRT